MSSQGTTYLQYVDTLASNMAEELILFIEVTAKQLRGLVYSMLDLHSDTSSSLGLLDNLYPDISCEKKNQTDNAHIKCLVIDLQRGTKKFSATMTQYERRHPHLPEVDDVFLPSDRVNLDHSQRCSNAKRSVENVDSEDDRIALTESRNRLETTRPHSLRSGVSPLSFRDLCVVRLERIKQVINNVG